MTEARTVVLLIVNERAQFILLSFSQDLEYFMIHALFRRTTERPAIKLGEMLGPGVRVLRLSLFSTESRSHVSFKGH